MLSISNIAGGGSEYYLQDIQGKSSYYLDGNSRTYWGGGAKGALGLQSGEIKKADFDRLMQGYVNDEQRIGNPCKTNGWKHDAGRDFTFSDPKSFSILLQGPLRSKLLDIKKNAVTKTMAYGEKHFAKARIKGEFVGNQKMIWAAVNEDTSRANDPNGHTHIVVFNIIQGNDGKFRAMDNPLFYDNQILLGQIYRAELAKGVKQLGFTIEPVGKHGQWEMKDIPKDIRETFSKRRQAILEKIDPKNDTAKARENICLITRPSKQNIMREELMKSWQAELTKQGTSFEELAIPKPQKTQRLPHTAETHIKTSMNIIAETEEHVSRHDLFRTVMSRSNGHITIDEVQSETKRQIKKGFIAISQDGEYISRHVDLRRKEQVTKEIQIGHLKSKPLLSKEEFEAITSHTTLKDDQKAAIRLITQSNSRCVKIQGAAGVGKTFALETVVPAVKNKGYNVIGLSTTSESTAVLEDIGVFDKVMTLQRYLLVPEGHSKTVLIIDESSMIGRDQMLSLLKFTNENKFHRVVFQGDANQMSGVQAGEPFKYMEQSGVRSIVMDEIIRQKDMRHRIGISALSTADLRKAFETLKPEIHEVYPKNMTKCAIQAWRNSGNPKTPIIIQTNRQKTEINAAIKAEKRSADPYAKYLMLKTWQAIHKSDTEKRFVESYKEASHVRFNRAYKHLGIKRGDIYKIDHINRDKAELNLSKGRKTRIFKPAKYKMGDGAIEIYRQEDRMLHEEDRIRFTRGGNRQPVNNNQYGTIKQIKGSKVTFELDKKTNKNLTLSLKDNIIRHIDHAWASTAHAFQGKTVDHAVVVMPSRKSPLTSLESLNTSASRHRLSLTLITDNAKALQRNIKKTLEVEKIKASVLWPDAEMQSDKIIAQMESDQAHQKEMELARNDRSVEMSL